MLTRSGAFLKIAGATKANVVVPIARQIVQIQCECTGVVSIVPIATAEKGVL